MDLLTQPVGLSHYLIVGAVLFVCGVVCMTIKRNAVGVLMGIELVLNGANLNFVAFGSPLLEGSSHGLGLDGQFIAMFVDGAGRRRGRRRPGHRLVLLPQPRNDRRGSRE